jgi:hypothetical protein
MLPIRLPYTFAPEQAADAAPTGTEYFQDVFGSISPSGTVQTSSTFSVFFSGSSSFSGGISKQTNRTASGIILPAGTIVKSTEKSLDSSLSPTGGIVTSGNIEADVAGSVAPSGSLSSSVTYTRVYSSLIQMVGGLSKQTQKALLGAITASGGLLKSVAKSFTGSITGSGAVDGFKFTPEPSSGILSTTIRHLRRFLGRR